MPYATNADLPEPVQKAYSDRCQTVFRHAFNASKGSEAMSMAFGHTAAKNCMASVMVAKAEALDPDELTGWIAGSRSRRLLAIPFGGPLPNPQYAKGMDLDAEWFSEKTDIKPRWFDARPITWQHGDDRTMGNDPFGKADNLGLEEDGWWVDTWITAHDRRAGLIKMLSERLARSGGQIQGSSAPIGRFVKTAKSGEILVWPYAEQTLGTAVQNSHSIFRSGKALVEDFDIAGIAVSHPLRDMLAELDALGADLSIPSSAAGEWAAKAGRVLSSANEAALRRVQVELAALLAQLDRYSASAAEGDTPT